MNTEKNDPWPHTSPATKERLAKGNYRLLKKHIPLCGLQKNTLRELARIVAEDLNRLRLDYMLKKQHFDSDKGVVGVSFEYNGKQWGVSPEALNKLSTFCSYRMNSPKPYTSRAWGKCSKMIQDVIKRRQFYDGTKELFRSKTRRAKQMTDVHGFTDFLLRLVDCINKDINPEHPDKPRHKKEVFELVKHVVSVFDVTNQMSNLTPNQTKGRITHNLPQAKHNPSKK